MEPIATEIRPWQAVFLRNIEKQDPEEGRQLREIIHRHARGELDKGQYQLELMRSRARSKLREAPFRRPFPTADTAAWAYAHLQRLQNLARMERDPTARIEPTAAEVEAGHAGKEAYYIWYSPIASELDTLAGLIDALLTAAHDEDADLIRRLLDRGTQTYDSVIAQLRSEIIEWLPMHMVKFSNVLTAWHALVVRVNGRE